MKEFLTEIDVISKIEHENLVKLYGSCVEQNQRILVYNYLENNSLAQTLIGNPISLLSTNLILCPCISWKILVYLLRTLPYIL